MERRSYRGSNGTTNAISIQLMLGQTNCCSCSPTMGGKQHHSPTRSTRQQLCGLGGGCAGLRSTAVSATCCCREAISTLRTLTKWWYVLVILNVHTTFSFLVIFFYSGNSSPCLAISVHFITELDTLFKMTPPPAPPLHAGYIFGRNVRGYGGGEGCMLKTVQKHYHEIMKDYLCTQTTSETFPRVPI